MAHQERDQSLGPLARLARKAPYLSKEEEYALLDRWITRRDNRALDKLSLSHTRLVIALALKFKSYGVPLSDLIQEGHIGLMEAANRFQLSKDVRFATYASWWIKSSIQDYVLRNQSIVRGGTSSRQKMLFFGFKRMRTELANKHPNLSEAELHEQMSNQTGAKLQDITMMAGRLSGKDASLNATLRGSETALELQDTLPADEPRPDELVELRVDGARDQKRLYSALRSLKPREQRIIRERKLNEQTITLKALSEKLGVSKERVRQIESRAMQKLKDALTQSENNTAD
ncbi:RNA polymerase factor sigma-32 [Pseudovibrio japonicus]|uniref:RNA polymerase factor sigma-32 n=1 Tax=Pseudovibrio japonicus TaxID=366534 RepID=A0ABQ3EG88_9HYPH|nr:RNA polymerase factor sigma-32 [Pseudovibrio japonicus]GHB38068.1 RNA polymerase factor sigma-32 [Pseudovibrio japonicus]